jgi:hypothetical protein
VGIGFVVLTCFGFIFLPVVRSELSQTKSDFKKKSSLVGKRPHVSFDIEKIIPE